MMRTATTMAAAAKNYCGRYWRRRGRRRFGWGTGIGGKERKDNLKSITNYKEHRNDATDTDSWLRGLSCMTSTSEVFLQHREFVSKIGYCWGTFLKQPTLPPTPLLCGCLIWKTPLIGGVALEEEENSMVEFPHPNASALVATTCKSRVTILARL